ncbi:MAG: hypothetical protein EXQ95_05360 [Alphaproteobacteria bacterium]|nr:hypothetical protein [Alphaproteobacteria bacterium]
MRITLETAERVAFAEGAPFGDAGPYERLAGKIRLAVDPAAAHNRVIVDLDKAPRGADGLVECVADFTILKPVDISRGNRRLFYDWGNRGNIRALQFFNDAVHTNTPRSAADAGNGFLFRRGYTMAWIAWEGDLLPGDGRFVLDTPVATDAGKPIAGPVRAEYVLDDLGVNCLPLSGRASTRSFPTVSLDTAKATLTVRRYPNDPRVKIDPSRWQFARLEGGAGLDGAGGETGIAPSDRHIYLADGFAPGLIYELVYTARDPRVHGLGHAMLRDAIGFFRHDASERNPLRGIEKAYCWGRSQTGRAIRDFVYLGFNDDGQERKVFDGVLPHVAGAGKQWFNHRFSLPVTPAGQQHEDHDNPADRFPFAYAEATDHNTGQRDAILKRPKTDPLVIHTQTATEYWQRRGSLVHTDTQGNDLAPPPGVRVFLWASSQHMADPQLKKPTKGVCQNYVNVVSTSPLFRAALDALDRWVTDGTPPPDSRMPRRADGTLVPMEAWAKQFPAIPGVMRPKGPSELRLLDYGPDFDKGILSVEPPRVLHNQTYAVLVPAVDADGNDLGGVRMPVVDAPLGTYTGWNLRARGGGHGSNHNFTGSYIPLPETDAEQAMTGDPRKSILARYRDKAGYVRAIEAAARKLVAERLMLEEDVPRVVDAARDWGRPRHDVRTLS